jgi:mannosyl-oligosaccharide alpha-1,2-mannosidase
MGMKAEFDEAVAAAEAIDFTPHGVEASVRGVYGVSVRDASAGFLGGLLSAYDLSGDMRLLRKAVEVGDMLYKVFDTPNRMPNRLWYPDRAIRGEKQVASKNLEVEALGGLSLEFTRLSMLTGDAKWFDAVQRVMDELAAQQDSGRLPGLWPWILDLQEMVFEKDHTYAVPTMAGSLAKTAALLGGQPPVYQTMYEKAMDRATQQSLFVPMTPTNEDILMAGQVWAGSYHNQVSTTVEYSSCALGGSMALGSKLFGRGRDLDMAKRLVDGCIWTCKAWSHGVMPLAASMVTCPRTPSCPWSEEAWKEEVVRGTKGDRMIGDPVRSGPVEAIIDAEGLPQGFKPPTRGRYYLRHEAIESVFVLYRTTGQPYLLESAWDMFTAINSTWSDRLTGSRKYDRTRRAPQTGDLLDPTWIGAALKYFYLIFGDPGVASLDDFVFNTDGHLFRRLVG